MIKIWLLTSVQIAAFALLAPIYAGILKKLKSFLQNRRGPSILQPYRDLRKLFRKHSLIPENASFIFWLTPYLIFGITLIICSVTPLFTTNLPLTTAIDVIVLVGLFALTRFFLALAGLDIGTAFGGMGSSREMTIATLAEPALMIAFLTMAIVAHSTNLGIIINHINSHQIWTNPSLIFTGLGFALVAIAETGRIPVDNPSTHLELTMVHEAMILEYSGKFLALIEWTKYLKLMLYCTLIANLFIPIAPTSSLNYVEMLISFGIASIKLLFLATALAITETILAKLRLFRVPLLLNMAFLLSLLGLLNYIILEVG